MLLRSSGGALMALRSTAAAREGPLVLVGGRLAPLVGSQLLEPGARRLAGIRGVLWGSRDRRRQLGLPMMSGCMGSARTGFFLNEKHPIITLECVYAVLLSEPAVERGQRRKRCQQAPQRALMHQLQQQPRSHSITYRELVRLPGLIEFVAAHRAPLVLLASFTGLARAW